MTQFIQSWSMLSILWDADEIMSKWNIDGKHHIVSQVLGARIVIFFHVFPLCLEWFKSLVAFVTACGPFIYLSCSRIASYPGPEGGEKRAWYLLHAHVPTSPRKPGVLWTTVRFFALLQRPRVRGYTDMTSLRTLGARGERKSVQLFAAPQVFLG